MKLRVCLIACVCVALVACVSQNRPVRLISGAGAIYPSAAEAQGLQGFVTLSYDVGLNGLVKNVRVVASEPVGVFDDAALAALAKWRFVPAIQNGEPFVKTGVQSTISFKLADLSEYEQYE